MPDIVRRARPFLLRVVVVQIRLQAGLRIARRIGERLAEGVAELALQSVTRSLGHFELHGVIGRDAAVGDDVCALHVRVRVEVDRPVQAAGHVLVGEFADLALTKVRLVGAVGQIAAAAQEREDRERHAAGHIRVVRADVAQAGLLGQGCVVLRT